MLSHLTRLNFPSRNLGENHLHLPLPVMRLLSSLKCEAKKNWGHGFKIDLIVAGPAGFTLPCLLACLLALLAHAGDLSLPVLGLLSRMNQSGSFIELGGRFSLPANIGDIDLEPSITVLDLRSCRLTGL